VRPPVSPGRNRGPQDARFLRVGAGSPGLHKSINRAPSARHRIGSYQSLALPGRNIKSLNHHPLSGWSRPSRPAAASMPLISSLILSEPRGSRTRAFARAGRPRASRKDERAALPCIRIQGFPQECPAIPKLNAPIFSGPQISPPDGQSALLLKPQQDRMNCG
jgi:hypothetical protein